jgi:hypothetical protein
MKKFQIVVLLIFCYFTTIGQPAGGADPALSYGKYLVLNNGNTYTLIGNFKVVGSPYYFGSKLIGKLFTKEKAGYDVLLRYDIYNQAVEFFSSISQTEPLVKEAGEVDSFMIRKDSLIKEDIWFIYGPLVGATDKAYYQLITAGKVFNLYKKYGAELGIVSTNYIQSDLRQFDLYYNYYYLDLKTRELKKLKTNVKALKKEFQPYKDISSAIDEKQFSVNQEIDLKRIFDFLNN